MKIDDDTHVPRMNNARLFRPEAVAAYTTRRSGEPWATRLPAERLLILILATMTLFAGYLLCRGGVFG
jgi:hypothetical protein